MQPKHRMLISATAKKQRTVLSAVLHAWIHQKTGYNRFRVMDEGVKCAFALTCAQNVLNSIK